MTAHELELLTEMLRLYSPSGEEASLAEYLREELARRDFKVRLDEVGNVIGTHGEGPPTLLLCGHMDTVPGELDVRLENDLLYGRGAVDAKASLASMIVGASKVEDSGGRIIMACLVDEEGNGKGVKQLIKENVEADYAVFGEPSRAWNITIGYKGGLHLLLECTTSTGHSSAPWLSDNAIEKCYECWEAIKRNHFEEEKAESRFYSVTSCLTRIEGGGSSGMIPSRCKAEIDVRTPPQLSTEETFARLKGIVEGLNKPGEETRLRLSSLGSVPAYESDPRSPLVRALSYSIRKVCGKSPTLLRKTGTGDMNELGASMKMPMISYGPGDSHLDHTPNEHISVEEYLTSIRVYQEAIPRLFDLHNSQIT